MPTRFIVLCCCLAPVTRAQTPWSLQNLRPLTQYTSLSTALSPNGDVYIAGPPVGFHWPQPTRTIGDTSSEEILISKLDASGNPIYVTVIGGAPSGFLALDAAGNLYVYGNGANASTFATTPGAFSAKASVTFGDYVCKLHAADGSILFCSFLETSGLFGTGSLAADPMGNVYFAESGPTHYATPTQGALALGARAVQVTKLDPVGAIIYRAEFSGPQGKGYPTNIAADAEGDVWVTGYAAPDFPTTPDALLPSTPQTIAGFLSKLNPSGTALLYSTFTDGFGSAARVAVDGVGNVYETDGTNAGTAILRKYSPEGTAMLYKWDLANSTLAGLPFAVDALGEVTALGATTSVNFPTYHPVDACGPPSFPGSLGSLGDWVLIRVDAAGKLLESTFLSIPAPYPQLSTEFVRYPQMAANGYFLITSTAMTNLAAGFRQLGIGRLGPAAGPPINLSCAGNAANVRLAALAPGEIVSLFGNGLGPASPVSAQLANNRLPFNLAGTQVTFAGIPAPLLYSSDSQINAIVPWEIQGVSRADVCVVYQSNSTNCVTMDVANAAPGIFQLPSGYAAVVNQDGAINGPRNPAAIGSIVSLYVTGLGPLSPVPVDGSLVGLPLPALANRVRVDFQQYAQHAVASGQVLYAGPAPLEVAGLYQINLLIPELPVSQAPIPLTMVQIEVDLADGNSVRTAVPGLPIAIQPAGAGNSAPP